MHPTPPPPSPQNVRDALGRILGSPQFRSAARQRQFLAYVVEETLAGRSDQLKEWSIARGGLGEPTNFDPRTDPLVRVLAGRVRASLAKYYAGSGADDPVRIDVPKGSYATTHIWAGDASDHRERHTVGPRLAVLSFVDLSPDANPPYFAVGFTESLVLALARFEGVPIVGPLAAPDPEEGIDVTVARVAAIGADLVLAGTVRTSGSVVRLGVRLLDVESATTRWSDTFEDRTSPERPFDAEDRIAASIGAQTSDPLGIILLADSPVPRTSDPGVYRSMLAYHAYSRSLDQRLAGEVIEGLERSHRHEPDNPRIAAMLAATLLFQGVGDVAGTPPSPELADRAKELARRSVQLAPGNSLGSLVLAFSRLLDGDPDDCRGRLHAILASSSHSPTFRSMCGIGLLLSGAWDDGIAHLREAIQLNPHHPPWQHGFLSLDALGRGDAVEALAEARVVDTPGLVWGPLLRAAAHGALGEVDRGIEELTLLDAGALTVATDRDRLLSHTRLPAEVNDALFTALSRLAPQT